MDTGHIPATAVPDECKLAAIQWYMVVAPPVDMLAALDDARAKRALTWLPLWYLATLGPVCEAQVSRVHTYTDLAAQQFKRMCQLATEVLETFYPNMFARAKGGTRMGRCIDFHASHCLTCRTAPFPESGFRVAPLEYAGTFVLCRSQ
ncbi:hypothetical protein SARC_03955 [Sphaeroforma arctica JP610]|uniref:Uncharacterized protein n=1 Tax=Sphaeroforma arctica JP610 TaxID=667725 RepID=A0A0L0G4G1_9EUKA|nr:hypothetical protein SARC_03955 [Sphaeroforma arctica JP610]KNC83779.1 hypothetical protein SARC_03955 [Sphaeroforma arctica JP610]|eukprot:XP_014157681.1 hypothetical protein SARC_03955 [Sphaeroforma arctica JP610]